MTNSQTPNDGVTLAPLTEIRKFFGYATLKDFRADWEKLTDTDRVQLRTGIGNGTFNY